MANEKRLITLSPEPTAGTWQIVFDGNSSSNTNLAYNADAATWQTEAETIAALTGNISVSGDYQAGYLVEFVVALANTNITAAFGLNSSTMTAPADDPSVAVITEGVNPVNEVQEHTFSGTGTYTLNFDGQETSTLEVVASVHVQGASGVQSALEALSNIGAGNVSVSAAFETLSPYTITFQGALAGTDVALITVTNKSIVDGDADVTLTTNGVAGVQEVQRITLIDFALLGGGSYWRVDTAHATQVEQLDADCSVAIESALEDFLGVGVSVVDAGDHLNYTVTWDDPGPKSTLAPVNDDLVYAITLNDATTQEGDEESSNSSSSSSDSSSSSSSSSGDENGLVLAATGISLGIQIG